MWAPPPPRLSSPPWAPQQPMPLPPEAAKRASGRGKEPSRPKTHWDYVLDEMAWLSKDFEKERKWKLAQAKKVAVKISKSKLENETKGQRRQKGEEQRIRRVASNISKDVKKFWTKIEKLVIYKHQLELEGRKKKALDKHLDFLVGQTERYSTMLAEILADVPLVSDAGTKLLLPPPSLPLDSGAFNNTTNKEFSHIDRISSSSVEMDTSNTDFPQRKMKVATDFSRNVKEDEDTEFSLEHEEETDDEATIEADEALITDEERREELIALERESSLPLEELLKLYKDGKDFEDGGGSEEEEEDDSDKEGTDDEDGTEETEDDILRERHETNEEPSPEDDVEHIPAALGVRVADQTSESGMKVLVESIKQESEGRGGWGGHGLSKQGVATMHVDASTIGNGKDHRSLITHCLNRTEETEATSSSQAKKSSEEKVLGLEDKNELGECILEQQKGSEDKIADAAAAAQSAQPTGFTYSTTKVRTKLPFLLKYSLREYQHIGLDWLVTMYEKRLNGILADEMGLGKTIMTIALLAHLACEKGIWGPHLIVVPTSVMLNWETEIMKWCPAFKVLTYFGGAKERKVKRQGWSKPNSFHICITTYRLVIQDAKAFKRKKWKYLILDEAHLIKNWKSQRWQTLLNFNSKRRILLTGTPLQNDLMELWSLMHFLMPHVFQSHQEFRDWFNNPITGMVEGQEQVNKEIVDRLHNVLRPFILRRLKQDVEKQLPKKYEHVIKCRLSKRQRNLYEDFMASSDTQVTLASGNFLGLINVLMQLRKVCNHPDLFEGRPITSSFDMPGIYMHLSSAVCSAFSSGSETIANSTSLCKINFLISQLEFEMSAWEATELKNISTPAPLIEEIGSSGEDTWDALAHTMESKEKGNSIIQEIQEAIRDQRVKQKRERAAALGWLNLLWCNRKPLYGQALRKQVRVEHPVSDIHSLKVDPARYMDVSSTIADLVVLPSTRCERLMDILQAFVVAIPAARAPAPVGWCSHPTSSNTFFRSSFSEDCKQHFGPLLTFLRPVIVRRQLFFPDRRLLQFDCGKLQELAVLLRCLKSEGHRALIFTQMTKMLDVLESFVNLHGYTYLRLDGSTKPEERQILMQRFNTNPKIFLFILSTRSGGVGVNLVGADTVIFYDSDWNPAMDQQAQDRCHRIGQTREVHIYRLISESTIEENILKKANQKRALDDLVIQSGSYNTDFFKKLDPMELLSGLKGVKVGPRDRCFETSGIASDASGAVQGTLHELSNSEVEAALKNAEDEADYMALKKVEQEEAAENQEFTEEEFAANMDDDECADDLEEGKVSIDRKLQADENIVGASKSETDDGPALDPGPKDEVLVPTDLEEDMDMLADVKQMAAAAAAAGNGNMWFEDQLQPIERYAMHFLEHWDPIVDKDAFESHVEFEETEWELGHLEKLKEEQEAEIDEDNEPLFYESWDTSFAHETYYQQVEVLAQQQEYQRQLDHETMEEELYDAERAEAEAAAAAVGTIGFENKNKTKKTKFKSLKKGSLTIEDDISFDKWLGRRSDEVNDMDWKVPHSLVSSLPSRGLSQRKRKAPKLLEEEMLVELYKKKMRREQAMKDQEITDRDKSRPQSFEVEGDGGESTLWSVAGDSESVVMLLDSALSISESVKKSKFGGKISIVGIPMKKGPLVKLEKERKKDAAKSRDRIPPADPWMPAEDAVLCAVVHEYGGNWCLASETLAGIPDGGVYRGRYRLPVHCRERFRQLLVQNTSIVATGESNSEKVGSVALTNAQLKVTEDHIKQLLEAVQQLADDELLLQCHFFAVLTSAGGRDGHHGKNQKSTALFKPNSSPQGLPFVPLPKLSINLSNTSMPSKISSSLVEKKFPPGDLVAAALAKEESQELKFIEVTGNLVSETSFPKPTKDQACGEGVGSDREPLEVTLDLVDTAENESDSPLPRSITISIYSRNSSNKTHRLNSAPVNSFRRYSRSLIEQRYRMACRMGFEGAGHQWAASAGSGLGVVGTQLTGKVQKSGKRRLPLETDKPSESKQPHLSKVRKKRKSGEVTHEIQSCKVPGGVKSGSKTVEASNSHLTAEASVATITENLPNEAKDNSDTIALKLDIPAGRPISMPDGTVNDSDTSAPMILKQQSMLHPAISTVNRPEGVSSLLNVEDSERGCASSQSFVMTTKPSSRDGSTKAVRFSSDVIEVAKSSVRAFSSDGSEVGKGNVRAFDLNDAGSSDDDVLTVFSSSVADSTTTMGANITPPGKTISCCTVGPFHIKDDMIGSSQMQEHLLSCKGDRFDELRGQTWLMAGNSGMPDPLAGASERETTTSLREIHSVQEESVEFGAHAIQGCNSSAARSGASQSIHFGTETVPLDSPTRLLASTPLLLKENFISDAAAVASSWSGSSSCDGTSACQDSKRLAGDIIHELHHTGGLLNLASQRSSNDHLCETPAGQGRENRSKHQLFGSTMCVDDVRLIGGYAAGSQFLGSPEKPQEKWKLQRTTFGLQTSSFFPLGEYPLTGTLNHLSATQPRLSQSSSNQLSMSLPHLSASHSNAVASLQEKQQLERTDSELQTTEFPSMALRNSSCSPSLFSQPPSRQILLSWTNPVSHSDVAGSSTGLERQTGVFSSGEVSLTNTFGSSSSSGLPPSQLSSHQLPMILPHPSISRSNTTPQSFAIPKVIRLDSSSTTNLSSSGHSLSHQSLPHTSLHHFRYANQDLNGPDLGLTLGPIFQSKPGINFQQNPPSPSSPTS